jgi:RND family efflux transporter MFP subunit
MSKPALVGGAVVLALAAAAPSLFGQSAGAGPPAAGRPALTVTVVQPQTVELAQTVSANGGLFAWQEASIGAEGNGWRLADVRVNVGDRVRRGQVLATFATELAQAEVAQSRAAVAEAEAMLAEATSNAQRARELQPSGVLSAQQTNQILTAERTAQARVEAIRAAARVQQLRLAQAQVLAPDDGVISSRSATLGAVVASGQELFRLIRQGRLEWRAEVSATDLPRIRPGQAVQVTLAGGATVPGRVRMVGPTVDTATRNGLVYVDLLQPGNALAGMFARGEFDVGRSSALTLPQSAVLLREGFSYVFLVGADGRVSQTKVSVGRRSGERIEIAAGLAPGARVVAAGAAFLADGDLVRVVEGTAPAPATTTTSAAPAAAPKR